MSRRPVRRVRRPAPPRPSLAARRRRDYIRAGVGAAVAVAVAVALVVLLRPSGNDESVATDSSSSSTATTLSRRERREQKQATEFRTRMQSAYTRLVRELPKLSEDVDALDNGSITGDAFLALHGVEVTLAEEARDQVAGIAGFPGDRRPKAFYQQASMLYVEAFRAFASAAHAEQPIRHELILHGKRVRTLADRVFDRGSKIVAAVAHDPPTPDIEVHIPEEVPNWKHEGYAAGPPVGSATANKVTVDESKKHRPTQSLGGWRSDVRTPVATVQDVVALLPRLAKGDDVAAARRAADRVERAAEKARAIADPKHRREAFATLRLAMLVEAESARAFALAGAAPATTDVVDASRARGRDLALIGDALWRLALADVGRPKALTLPATHFDATGLLPRLTSSTTSGP